MSKQTSETTVLLFSRSPDDRRAKSRLQETLPPSLVHQLHRAFVLDTLAALRDVIEITDIVCSWDVEGENELDLLRHLIPAHHEIQQGISFAEKLTKSLLHVRESTSGPIIVIGSDCPLLSPEILRQAIEATQSGRLVIGPAPQGGFYLAGLPKNADISSFGEVFHEALEACSLQEKYQALPLFMLPFLYDIDLEEDLVSLIAELRLRRAQSSNAKHPLTQTDPPFTHMWIPENTYHLLKRAAIMKSSDSRDKRVAAPKEALL